jgi:tetratricopeptide (TPR) repeat protein
VLDEKSAQDIFSVLANGQNGLDSLSNQFLENGIDQYQNENYAEAAVAFEAAIGIAPNSELGTQTAQYLVQTYLQLEKTDKAIETYQNAILRNPDDDELRTALGQLYYSEERYEESAAAYGAAVNINPSVENRYAYGEALVKIDNFSEAGNQFNEVKRLAPDSYAGDYGLGKMYARDGQFEKAIEHFTMAVETDPTFLDAYAEIGYAYADMDEIELARVVQEELEEVDESLASTLESYIDEVEAPRIAFAYATDAFPYKASSGYPVAAIDTYLENAGAELGMTMAFQFSKEMDASSVENRFNWKISRASSSNLAETYNFGDRIPSTEITLDTYPDYVLYDADAQTATVGFTIRQNETADGTIDPSHISFQFDGEDACGVAMDEDGDTYTGFSGSA